MLEYVNVEWDPRQQYLNDKIEMAQKWAAK